MEPSGASDDDLIRRIREGQTEPFSELVRRHETSLYRVGLAFLGDPDEAEEAAQEVFVKAYRSLADFKGDSSFRTWATRIAINHCKDLLRRRGRRTFLSIDAFASGEAPHPRELIVAPPSAAPEGFERARKVLDALPEGDREILVLFEVEELSYEEIAATLKVSLDAVKGRLKRARQRVRDLLGKETA
jgi:RNA polymerase sigma-70 factor (ECF subfamily)